MIHTKSDTKHDFQVVVDVERNQDGFFASIEGLDGLISHGDTLEELKSNLNEAFTMHIEGMKEDGDDIPEVFTKTFTWVFQPDLQQYFEYLKGVINTSELCRRLDISPSIFSQYMSGKKSPSKKRVRLIMDEVKNIGSELSLVY